MGVPKKKKEGVLLIWALSHICRSLEPSQTQVPRCFPSFLGPGDESPTPHTPFWGLVMNLPPQKHVFGGAGQAQSPAEVGCVSTFPLQGDGDPRWRSSFTQRKPNQSHEQIPIFLELNMPRSCSHYSFLYVCAGSFLVKSSHV